MRCEQRLGLSGHDTSKGNSVSSAGYCYVTESIQQFIMRKRWGEVNWAFVIEGHVIGNES